MTRNEMAVAGERAEHWHLYRVHLFAQSPRIFTVRPPFEGVLRICLPSWRTDEKTWLAYFGLAFAGSDDGEWSEENFWLTRLCAEGRGSMGFRFFQDEFGRTPWKKLLNQQADLFDGTRFVVDDLPSVFLPVKVDRQALSTAVENENIADALGPIAEALDLLAAELPKFEQLRQHMRERQAPT